jgi:Tfp pilus assembly protein PilF
MGACHCLPVILLVAALAASPHPTPSQPTTPATSQPATAATQPQPVNITQPQQPPTPEQLADALMMHQRYQEAIETYRKVAQPSAAVWNKMGISYQMLLNTTDATRCYRASLKLDPHNAHVLNNLGTIYDLTHQPRAAERMYRQALKADPQSAITYKNLGTNLLGQQKFDRGWDAYKKALAIDPNVFHNTANPRVEDATSLQERGALNYYMARGCAHTGQVDCAVEYLRMALIEGYTTPKKLMADAEFTTLLSTQAFQQLIADQSNPTRQPHTETASAPAPPPSTPDQPNVGR